MNWILIIAGLILIVIGVWNPWKPTWVQFSSREALPTEKPKLTINFLDKEGNKIQNPKEPTLREVEPTKPETGKWQTIVHDENYNPKVINEDWPEPR